MIGLKHDHHSTEFFFPAFVFLSFERILYSYWYLFPEHFKLSANKGTFGKVVQKERHTWQQAKKLGIFIKVFQFGVVFYDLCFRNTLTSLSLLGSSMDLTILAKVLIGWLLIISGQILNYATYKALGAVGVYYGYEFGYDTPRVSGFPYNIGINDPQYWGVVMTCWGAYLALGAEDFMFPILETFWYLVSMQVLENPRGRAIARFMIGDTYKRY